MILHARINMKPCPTTIIPRMRDRPPVTPLDLHSTPLELAARWPEDRPLVMLHSGRFHPRWARWSLLATPSAIYRFDGRSQWICAPPVCAEGVTFTHDPLIDVDLITQATRIVSPDLETTDGDRTTPFHGGWIGSFSYDLGRWIEPRAQHVDRRTSDHEWPLIELAWCQSALLFDHQTQRWLGVGDHQPLVDGLPRGRSTRGAANQSSAEYSIGAWRAEVDPDQYVSMVARTKEYIAAGDVFQANIARRFTARFEGSTRALAIAALGRSQPWYGAYLEHQHSAMISLSPELFLQIDPCTRQIVTRPIKGTRPTRVNPRELLDSAKDAAELHMIVDLMRNDLGRVCEFGSVQVPHPRVIESHPTVHHGVGEVTGTLRHEVSVGDVLKATFPGGSVTGAPKIRAMQIIDELEQDQRGPYCGAIGYISDCGALALNIAIRTMLVRGEHSLTDSDEHAISGTLEYWAGAGIVADSNPLAEYAETLDKAAVLRLLNDRRPEPAIELKLAPV